MWAMCHFHHYQPCGPANRERLITLKYHHPQPSCRQVWRTRPQGDTAAWSVNHLRYWCHHYQLYGVAVANHLEPPPPPRNLIVAVAADDTAQRRHASTFSRPEFSSKISRRTDSVWILWTIPLRPSRCFFPVCSQPYRYFQYLVACNNYRTKVLSRIAICHIIICKIWRFKSGYPLWASKIPAGVPPAPAVPV